MNEVNKIEKQGTSEEFRGSHWDSVVKGGGGSYNLEEGFAMLAMLLTKQKDPEETKEKIASSSDIPTHG